MIRLQRQLVIGKKAEASPSSPLKGHDTVRIAKNGKKVLLLSLAVFNSTDIFSQEQTPPEPVAEKSEQTEKSDKVERTEKSEKVQVTGRRLKHASKGATGLDLNLFDTPQSITSMDRELLDSFAFEDVTSTLRYANGVNVESVETDRTSFFSRGYEIKHMQVDGVNTPFEWNLTGSLDTSVYERLDVVRGANGLLTGTGSPSGTINFIRKRPKRDFEAVGEISTNSYGGSRFEADVSTPLNGEGTWAARVVGTSSNEKSWIDRYENNRTVLYGVIEGQVTDNISVTLGYIDQKSDSDNPLWGAIPVVYSNGTPTDYDVSTSQSMDWTYWDTYLKTAFADLTVALSDTWQVRAGLSQTRYDQAQETIWYSGLPDADTGLGMSGYPGGYQSESDIKEFNVTATGDVPLFGRDHQLVLGYANSTADTIDKNKIVPDTDPIWGPAPPFGTGYKGNEIPRPGFPAPEKVSDTDYRLIRYTGAMRINPADAWKIILGFNSFASKSNGVSYGSPNEADDSETTPYAGLIWSATPDTNIYFSYSEIFQPQTELNDRLKPLGPARGLNYEVGAKTELFKDKLLLALAYFQAEQKNLAEWLGEDPDTLLAMYKGSHIRSKGVEFDVTGYLSHQWKILGGYSNIDLSDIGGTRRTYLPNNTFKLLTTYDVTDNLTFGGSMRWQDSFHYTAKGGTEPDTFATRITQESYAILGLNADYKVNQHVSLSAVVDNLTDEKYYNSFYWADIYGWNQAVFGAPRNGRVAINLRW